MSKKETASKLYSTNRSARSAVVIVSALVIAVLTIYRNYRSDFSGNNPQTDDGRMADDLARVSEEEYEAVLVSMHSTDYFREEDFLNFRGRNTLVASHAILNTKELSEYLECILHSENIISEIYICADPELLWTTAHQKEKYWTINLTNDFYSYIEARPDISFSILLPYPYISYWLELDDDKQETLLSVYHTFVSELCAYPNVRVFYPGSQNWLIVNPANYTDTLFDANEVITQSVFLHIFCDEDYAISPENEELYWTSLRETILREKTSPTRYADLSDWCLVFFGDSVLGNYPGTFSIPGYVNGLSDAMVFNYAVGGTPACYGSEKDLSFPNVVDKFLKEDVSSSENGLQFTPKDIPVKELADKKLCFIIQYGFNDYFSGLPVENPEDPYDIHTFKGSMLTCISRLQEAFPDSCQIVMTPTHTKLYDYGMEVNSEIGDSLSAYINAAKEAAEETGAFLLDNYDFIATEQEMNDYLADGTHPNETGRLLIGDRIVRFMDTELQ